MLESKVFITWFLQDRLNLSKMQKKNNSNTLVKLIFNEDLAYTFSGQNIFCGRTYLKEYSTDDERCAIVLRDFLLSSSTVNIILSGKLFYLVLVLVINSKVQSGNISYSLLLLTIMI